MDPATRTLVQVTMEDAACRRPRVLDADGRPGRAAPRVHRGERPARHQPGRVGGTQMSAIDTIGGGNIEPRGLEEEMRSAYLDYAMSVIVGRALPDVRDGLKPVHRRVLHVMNEIGLQPAPQARQVRADRRRGDGQVPPPRRQRRSTTRSCASRRTSRCAIRSSTGTGTSATSTADSAAAMRYTEARLDRLATEMLRDIERTRSTSSRPTTAPRQEPVVLPARFPNLLSTAALGSPSGWRRTSRRTTCAR